MPSNKSNINKERGFRAILPCAKGYVFPTLITPVLMIFEVAMEVFIPLLMAAIVDGGLYRKADFQLRSLFSPELIADNTRFILTLGALICGTFFACLRNARRKNGGRCRDGLFKEPSPHIV